MTTNEEMRRVASIDRPYQNLSEIIDACMVEGPGISAYDMCIGDYQYLLHKLRVVTYGPEYKVVNTCQYCGSSTEDIINLEDLNILEYSEDFEKYKIKSKIVSEDEKEKGIRKILNFGHTLGHIVEKNSDFYHGEAVAVGMYEFAKLSEKLGFADNISEKIKQLLSFYNLPFEFNADIEILEKYMKKDKKSQGEYIDCILLREIGKAFINKIKIKGYTKTYEIY